jgi:hypothetical protein
LKTKENSTVYFHCISGRKKADGEGSTNPTRQKIGSSEKYAKRPSRPIMPNADQATAIAKALGTTVGYLTTGEAPLGWRAPQRIEAIVNDLLLLDESYQRLPLWFIHYLRRIDWRRRPMGANAGRYPEAMYFNSS